MPKPEQAETTAGVIIIGDEILSGKVRDDNAHYLAAELWSLGVRLMRVSMIPDDIDTIAEEVVRFSQAYDHVFTTGGVGPTHDDRTIEAIAKGFGTTVIRHPKLLDLFRTRYGDDMNDAVLKMAEVPEGAEIIEFNESNFPLVAYRNIYIFPGIPEFLRRKFSQIKERFRTSSFYLRRLFLKAYESDIAGSLHRIVAIYPNVAIGSYPITGNAEYSVIVTVESRDKRSVDKAIEELLAVLPTEAVVRVE